MIGKVIALNQYLIQVKHLPERDIRNEYVAKLLSSADTLFSLAWRELAGKDCLKRALETIGEIVGRTYLIYSLHGWSNKVAARIDAMCAEITAELCKADAVNSRNHEV